mmetsp:Transcript_107482/g.310665  ORF Transcript_107482/g.310665 Transcript_107482/m.310665 type:complete len:148 (+) Transcript_107482:150-593(+)
MVEDRVKVVAVVLCYAVCLGTFFSSPTITFGNSSLPSLKPQIQQHCKVPLDALRQCNKDCQPLRTSAKMCEKVVRKAYRHVNFGGCPNELKTWTLCEAEWCQKGMDGTSCLSECAGVRENLENCKQGVVESYFHQHRLEKDGTQMIA